MSDLNNNLLNNEKSTESIKTTKREFKPTYLYVKTHNLTGLKYFGKTISKNPFKYKGSGTRWLNHISKHGNDVSTEIVGFFDNEEQCVSFAKKFCEENNVVSCKSWANLKEENGIDGGFFGEESRKKMSENQIKRVIDGTHHFIGPDVNKRSIANGTNAFAKGDEVRERVKNKKHLFLNKEWRNAEIKRRVDSGIHNFLGGELQLKRVENGTHPFLYGEMQRKNILKRIKEGTHPTQIKKICPYCNKESNLSSFAHFHGDKCKMKNSTQSGFSL
jgi:hypothetical protein